MVQLESLSSSKHVVHRKRRKEELIARILMGARNEASKTRIMYFSCVNYPRLKKYIAIAKSADLLRIENNKCSITEKGVLYLNHFLEFKKMQRQMDSKKIILDELLQDGKIDVKQDNLNG